MPEGRNVCLLAVGLLSFVWAASAFAVGPYEDAARISAFVRAPQSRAVLGLITRSDGEGQGASFFWLGAHISLKDKFLLQPEVPYISMATDDEIRDGFGDIRLRAKARVWYDPSKALFLLGSVRFGSGSNALFPYSTQSTDYEIGIGFVDTLGTRDAEGRPKPLSSFSFWVQTTGVYATRVTDRLKEPDLHGNYVNLGAGVVFPLFRRFEIEVGGLGLFFRSGVVREIYFSQLNWRYSRSAWLFATVQAERGEREERASDAAAMIGLHVVF